MQEAGHNPGHAREEEKRMKFGDKFTYRLINRITGEKGEYEHTATYKYAEWRGWHTSKYGDGLWCGDQQILGTCQFSVAGCSTEKAAKAKIRNFVKAAHGDDAEQPSGAAIRRSLR